MKVVFLASLFILRKAYQVYKAYKANKKVLVFCMI